jgi:hypothetical protein
MGPNPIITPALAMKVLAIAGSLSKLLRVHITSGNAQILTNFYLRPYAGNF